MTKIIVEGEEQNRISELEDEVSDLEMKIDDLEQENKDKEEERDTLESEKEEVEDELMYNKEEKEGLEELSDSFEEAMRSMKKYIMKEYWDEKRMPVWLEEVEEYIDKAFGDNYYKKIQCEKCNRIIGWGNKHSYRQKLKEGFCSKECRQLFRLKE